MGGGCEPRDVRGVEEEKCVLRLERTLLGAGEKRVGNCYTLFLLQRFGKESGKVWRAEERGEGMSS